MAERGFLTEAYRLRMLAPVSCAGRSLSPARPPIQHNLPAFPAQAEAERQSKIREEVKHELRMFYCQVSTPRCAVLLFAMLWIGNATATAQVSALCCAVLRCAALRCAVCR